MAIHFAQEFSVWWREGKVPASSNANETLEIRGNLWRGPRIFADLFCWDGFSQQGSFQILQYTQIRPPQKRWHTCCFMRKMCDVLIWRDSCFPLQHELRVVLMGHTWPRVWPVPIEESPKAMMKDLAAHSYPTISHMKGCKPTCLWEAKWYFGMLILNQRHEGAIGLWQISWQELICVDVGNDFKTN